MPMPIVTLAQASRSYISRMLRNGVFVLLVSVCLGAVAARAQDATWGPPVGSSDYNTASNWSPPTPGGPTGTATFGTSNTTTITFSIPSTSVSTLQFNAGAPAYSFNLSNADLLITGTGIVNNSSNSPTFSLTSSNGNGGVLFFQGGSTAGAATITNNSLGVTEFLGTSNAGTATITTNNSGITDFFDTSTAGTATITTNSGGFTFFENTSTGGQARFITNSGGIFDISNLASGGMTAGSIEGAGTYDLGSNALTVGLNNLSTEVSGTIADGGVFGGTGGALIKVGTGTLTLSGANTYTGGTTISAGTFQLGDGGANGSILGNVTNNATLAFDRSDIVTFAGLISGSGNLTQIGSGTTILVADNTYTGGTTISAGTLQLGEGGANGSILGNVTNNATLAFDRSDIVTFAGLISGSGNLTQIGSGTTILAADNTYTGGTNFNGGILAVNSDSNLGTGPLSFNGGTLEALAAGGGITSSKAVTLNAGGGTFLADTGTTSTFSAVITGVGAFIKDGLGTLTLTGANTYSGGTTITAGTLQLGNFSATGSIVGAVVNNDTFNIFNANTAGITTITNNSVNNSNAITNFLNTSTAGNATITNNSQGLTVFNNTSSADTATITNNSLGSTHFQNASTAGNATINNNGGDTIFIEASTADTATVTNNSGGLTQFGDTSTAGNATITTNNGGVTVFLSSSTAGNATVTTNDGGVTFFFGSSTGGQARFVTNSGGIFDISGLSSGTTAGSIEGAGAYFLGSNALTVGLNNLSTEVSGTIADGGTNGGTGGALIKVGTGTLTLSGANTYTGGTTISAGTLQLGDGGANGSILGNVTNNATLAFDRSDIVTFAGLISGSGNLTQIGSGTTILTADNNYTGATTISAGTLQLGEGGANGSILGNVTNNATLAFDRSDTVTFAGLISGSGNLTQIGSGTTILAADNTYTGGTNFNGGILAVNSDSNLGTGPLRFNGGTLEALAAGGGITSTKAITLNAGGGTFLADTGTTSSLSGAISGVGAFTKNGGGTLALIGNNAYSGGTSINAGMLQIGNGGTSGIIAGDVSDNATFAFDRSDSVAFGGVISGTGALVQMGSGILTLTADNSYGGGTTINTGATLQLGNGGTTGSVVGNVTDNGSLIFNRSDNVTFNAIISGSGNLAQNGSGTTILGGPNTYSGGTIINNGTLLVNNSRALGLGNVVVNGGVLGADPQPINVVGNYTQNAGGTLQLQVAGANPGQYDTLNVGGNAALGGTLQLISLGFQPKAGNRLTLVTTGGVVSSRFGQFVDPFATGPGFTTVDLVYGRNSVLLEFLNIVPPVPPVITTIDFASFALTPNQSAAANLLDAVQLDPRAANLISFLDKEPFANLSGDFDKISPDGLTAFYEISFSNANIQKLNLEGRLDDIHNGSTGFSSNMKVSGATVNLEDKAGVDGKSSKGVVEPVLQPGPENRWGVWVTGFGDFVNVDGDGNAKGYDFTTGGVSLGIDYRITDQLAIGAMGEYSHTWTSLNPSGHIDVDSGRGGLYASWFNHGIYLNGAIYGGHNNYDSSRAGLGGLATGGTEGAEWSTFISGGYDFHFGRLSTGPIASLQYTYVNIDGFSEKSSLAPMQIRSGSAESLRSDVGFRAFYQWRIGKILVEPSLKAAWEHEYKYSALPITAGFAGIPGPSATFFGPNEGHDSAVVSAGVSAQWTPAISTYVNYDGQLGRGNYDSNAVTGGFRICF